MPEVSNWMHVDVFTVEQAAALWCGIDPARFVLIGIDQPSEFTAAKQMLTGAIIERSLAFDDSTNGLRIIGDHSKSLVRRIDLEQFARSKKLFPAFLFDTILPFEMTGTGASPQINANPLPSNQPLPNIGGRPPEYDWNAFAMEIIRLANLPDGLPEKQSDLVTALLEWFGARYGKEPAESSVKARVSAIYRYISEARNPSQ